MKVIGNTFADIYEGCLRGIIEKPEFVSYPRGQEIAECLGVTVKIINPYGNLFENKIRSVPKKYLANELVLYFAGKYNVESLSNETSFGEASSFWKNIANKDGTVNSAYGYLLFKQQAYEQQTQWEWVMNNLKKDKDTRQAICHINRPFHQTEGNKDFVCTMSYHFFIRENKLYMHCHRRSQDMYFGMTYDVPWELLLMQCAISELKDIYPDLEMGTYKLFIGSAHVYGKDFDKVKEMLKHDFNMIAAPMIDENPILNIEISKMAADKNYRTGSNDELIKWISENRVEQIFKRNSD